MPTISVEDYIKTIYHLAQRSPGSVKTKEIADALGVALPSVTSMLKSLAGSALITYQPYHGAQLTEAGRRLALNVVRKHRLVEVFLVNTLGYTWDEVHEEAERLEHAMSDELAARIDRYLSYPRFDPHGDPIPDADGQLRDADAVPTLALSAAPLHVALRVERVLDQDPELLRYLDRVGLVPGARCSVQEVLSFDGMIFLIVAPQDRVSITHALASRLLVSLGAEAP
jgi:DtxR family Mn-dependent transcriptional regulator